jgi:glycosyltransferase involved in cell wall biosynthesis
MRPAEASHRLVVLTYHFPPDGAVGGLRWAGIGKHLAPFDWASTVVTAAPPYQGPETTGIHSISVRKTRTLADLYRKLSRADARDRSPGGAGTRPTTAHVGPLRRLRREAGTLSWFPDECRGWILRAAIQLRRVISSTDPHVIVSSGPPHGAHVAAWLATRGMNVPWFADLRDPWAYLVWPGHRQVESVVASASACRLERLIATRCTGMIANTPALVQALVERYPQVQVTCVPNGVDRELLPQPDDGQLPGFALAHVGSLYGRRDMTPLLRAMHALRTRRREATSEDCTIHLVGEVEGEQREALHRVATELGLADCVRLYGAVPRLQALQVLGRSHAAVVVAQGQDMMIPAKLYEAVAIARAVLVLAPPASATAIEAARLGARVVDPSDVHGLEREVEHLWARRRHPAAGISAAVGYDAVARDVDKLLRSAMDTGARKRAPRRHP